MIVLVFQEVMQLRITVALVTTTLLTTVYKIVLVFGAVQLLMMTVVFVVEITRLVRVVWIH
jgi:hypothetical protein